MILTTLCYIEKDDSYLMLHRVKKNHDVNKDKWIGVGGKFEQDETPEECLLRETMEETGLALTSYRLRGILTFVAVGWETEYIFLYTADQFEGILNLEECGEGTLKWMKKDQIRKLNLWVGDRIFFHLMEQDLPVFSLKLSYDGDRLVEAFLDGKKLAEPWSQYYEG
ncbi:MAG: 8-oxo-dGTP diphosphatase [Lachnospiraceae bacterium]|nr:8-oxo-dGTP diphosphatase [Lachnospiraceae bacterium]